MSKQKYTGIAELLKGEPEALEYFRNLPLHVRERVAPHGGEIDSFETLKGYVKMAASNSLPPSDSNS